jgi:DNA-binding protein YbaB
MPKGYDLQAALADLRAEQERIKEASDRMAKVTGSATSKDRMISATVDSQGRLVALKLAGTRYRQLSPKELTSRIVEIVRSAQDDSARAGMTMMRELMPAGLGVPVDGDFDLDAMFDAAVTSMGLAAENSVEVKENNRKS